AALSRRRKVIGAAQSSAATTKARTAMMPSAAATVTTGEADSTARPPTRVATMRPARQTVPASSLRDGAGVLSTDDCRRESLNFRSLSVGPGDRGDSRTVAGAGRGRGQKIEMVLLSAPRAGHGSVAS